ncbi:Hint domain-containing protein [Pseudooceanicola nanhaiensis]|uniref:Hint domain-containing protein n=1 Tax=Pseudooceanicola nanhaiensis TaxID=375761 RepID=UPI001CD37E19|nr:Hint domain-containing protein [Pseudooceanicola nanhaiensis]MCA0919570.1 Hint domain-containing protein [Pseudooceanicola nanhaiensis]
MSIPFAAPFGATAPVVPMPSRPRLITRRYEIDALDGSGDAVFRELIAPANARFESAFNGFARGTLIATPTGRRAIEDLRPGDLVETEEFGPQPVQWIGHMTLEPGQPLPDPAQARLSRLPLDSHGVGRPSADLLVGPGARLLHRPAVLNTDGEAAQVYTPVSQFTDGETVVEIAPLHPVDMYHLCLPKHATIRAGGLPFESFHPGYALESTMGPNALALFLALFPHIDHPSDFGLLAHPRMSRAQLEALEDAA